MNIQRPNRKQHSYVQSIRACPDRIFPLFCPVAEAEWEPDWMPELVLTNSGLVESECIFVTKAEPADAVWIVTHHNRQAHEVEMYKITPGHTVCKLTIVLTADGADKTRAQVTYCYTSLGPSGDAFLERFTESWYEGFMQDWEKAMNHYLMTGTKIEVNQTKGQ